MAKQWEYDAFISYRHLPLDLAVAERTQRLLENYRSPHSLEKDHKHRIERIFRDQTELPTSGDLDNAIQSALRSSRFLIVVLSRKLQESKWCMEEIRSFKEAHGGKIDHILPILVDGEPDESIPDILRHETRKIVHEDGTEEIAEVEVEPLCCDVRADSTKGALKKLKTEFLRLAAPMLDVGYDDLYQRHIRAKKRKATFITASTIILLVSVISVISYFSYQTYLAQQRYQSNLVDTYAQQGAAQITDGDWEQAMMYYGKALELDNQTQAAKTGALLLLQQHGWLNYVDSDNRWIIGEMIYENVNQPYAVDETKNKMLSLTSDGLFMIDKDSNMLADLSSYGDFLSSAQDGSCWTFADEGTITFFFPQDMSAIQVERPKAINPQCDPEEVELYGDIEPEAMAVNRTRAAVCYGGYLYLYRLDENSGQGTLFETFDLATVFGSDVYLAVWPWVWIDAGGYLAIVYDGSTAAVFNIANENTPCLNKLHEVYGHELQSVAFSADGEHYALVYGNDDGIYDHPGGCLEVYDQYGNICMATEFDGGTALVGAMFEPYGNRIAAWGSGEVQVWNWTTGVPAVSPLQILDVTSVVWLDDGQLAVGNGKGKIDYYTIVRYEAGSSAPQTLMESQEQDYRQQEVVLSTGIHFQRGSTKVSVTDSEGNVVDQQWLVDLGLGTGAVNRMFLDKEHDIVYIWYNGKSSLFAFKADETGITSVSEINTRGKKPLSLHVVWNGVLAEMGTGELLYYQNGETETSGILIPGTAGSVYGVTSDANGLVSFVIRSKNYTEGVSYEYVYSVELWDLNKNVMLAELEANSRREITGLTFAPDNRLAFAVGDETVTWLLDAPSPNDQLINTLQSMSCYKLDEAQNTQIVVAAFDPQALGNWNELLHIFTEETTPEAEENFIEKMNIILEEQGEDAWVNAYITWWSSAEPESTDITELCDIMGNFFDTARTIGREHELRDVLGKFVSIVCPEDEYSLATAFKVESVIYNIIFYTPENADLAAEYYERTASMYENRAETGGELLDWMLAYNNHVTAGIVQGRGTESFDVGDDGLYDNYADVFMEYGLQVYADLLSGMPETAAADYDAYCKPESAVDYWELLLELSGYVRLGVISESDYSDFVRSLKYPTGIRLAQVSNDQLKSGLRLGDIVVAINGVYFGTPQYLQILQEKTPFAAYTVIRSDGTIYTTSIVSNWKLAGGFPE